MEDFANTAMAIGYAIGMIGLVAVGAKWLFEYFRYEADKTHRDW